MQPNNNLSCIPFYQSLEEQDYRKWYAYGEKYPYRVPNDCLVPFHFVIPLLPDGEEWQITELKFYRACCDEGDPISGTGSFNLSFSDAFDRGDIYDSSYLHKMKQNLLYVYHASPYFDEVVYMAELDEPLNLPRGYYFMEIVLEGTNIKSVYYSDIFYVEERENIEKDCIHIKWWNEENVDYEGGLIPYGANVGDVRFKSEIYLDTEIGKPTYNFTEEGEERNGHFFPIKQISEKSYNMGFLAPEYLCDVMRLIRMADRIKITDKLGRIYNAEQFEMEVEWLEQGHIAEVSCAFQTDTVVKKVGKAYNQLTDR